MFFYFLHGTRTALKGPPRPLRRTHYSENSTMAVFFVPTLLAAAGWSLLYMLFGGGLVGAILIFVVLKALGR